MLFPLRRGWKTHGICPLSLTQVATNGFLSIVTQFFGHFLHPVGVLLLRSENRNCYSAYFAYIIADACVLLISNFGSGCPASASNLLAIRMPTPKRCTSSTVRIASAKLGFR